MTGWPWSATTTGGRQHQPGVRSRPQLSTEHVVGDLERVGHGRQQSEQLGQGEVAVAGERAPPAAWMTASTVGGACAGASHSWTKRSQPRGSEFSSSSDEVDRKKWRVSIRIPAFVRSTAARDGSCGGEVTGLGPRRELELDADAEVEGQVAEAAEAVGGAGAVGVGELADDVPGPDRGRVEDRQVLVGLVVGAEPGQLDVEHLDVRVGQALHDLAHHCRRRPR